MLYYNKYNKFFYIIINIKNRPDTKIGKILRGIRIKPHLHPLYKPPSIPLSLTLRPHSPGGVSRVSFKPPDMSHHYIVIIAYLDVEHSLFKAWTTRSLILFIPMLQYLASDLYRLPLSPSNVFQYQQFNPYLRNSISPIKLKIVSEHSFKRFILSLLLYF